MCRRAGRKTQCSGGGGEHFACCGIPDSDCFVKARRNAAPTLGSEGPCEHTAITASYGVQRVAALGIQQARTVIPLEISRTVGVSQGRRHELTVRTVRQRIDAVAAELHCVFRPARLHIPKLHLAVVQSERRQLVAKRGCFRCGLYVQAIFARRQSTAKNRPPCVPK